MSDRRQRRKEAKAAREEREAGRRRARVIAIAAGALVVIVIASAVVVPGVVRRQQRLQRALVYFPAGTEAQPFNVLSNALRGYGEEPPSGLDATLRLLDSPDADAAADADVVVDQGRYGTERTKLVAADPYVLIVDRRAGPAPLEEPGGSLEDLTDWLSADVGDAADMPRFVVAAEHPVDFAAFILYLAGELLDAESRERIRAALLPAAPGATGPADGGGPVEAEPELVEQLVAELRPVISFLEDWTSRGILAFNWTNWDRIAVRAAHAEGRAAASFQARSEYAALGWEEAFHLRMHLPPIGPQRRLYRMVGRAVVAEPGPGPRADAAAGVRELLLAPEVQEAGEAETSLIPVRIAGTPINREHRDVVRWLTGADSYIVVDEATAAHPLFERVHQLLR